MEVFFPSCKAKASYKDASVKLQEYVKEKMQIDPVGCCRVNYQKLTEDDTAVVVCNNCAAIMEESSHAGNIEFVWSLIDGDAKGPALHGGGEGEVPGLV